MPISKKIVPALFFASIVFVIFGCGSGERLEVGIRLVGPFESDTLSYEDNNIRIEFLDYFIDRIIFTLHNRTDSIIRVFWDDGAFIDKDGSISKLFKIGTDFLLIGKPINPTIIHPGKNIRAEVLPVDNISLKRSGWSTGTLVPRGIKGYFYVEGPDEPIVSLFLPIEVAGELIEYKFTFEIRFVYR